MPGFRGTDELLEQEIAEVERIARLRLRRATEELRALDRDLSALKRERGRRRVESAVPSAEPATAAARS